MLLLLTEPDASFTPNHDEACCQSMLLICLAETMTVTIILYTWVNVSSPHAQLYIKAFSVPKLNSNSLLQLSFPCVVPHNIQLTIQRTHKAPFDGMG
jgi:hypothetical protein